MAKTNVSVYLAKTEMDHADIVLGLSRIPDSQKRVKPAPLSRQIPGVGTLYYRKTEIHTPDWVGNFFCNEIDSSVFSTSSPSAILVMKVRERTMALTFGTGRYLLNMSALEERFGLKVLLNSCEEGSFRKVNSTEVAGNTSKVAEQMPRRAKLSDFEINYITDTLDKVVASPQDDDLFTGTITGDDKLSFTTDENMRTIKAQLKFILDRYESNAYKERYPWIDHVVPVSDKEIIRCLESAAVEMLNDGNDALWTAPPELIENWDHIAGFKWPGCRGELRSDILVEDIIATIGPIEDYRQLKTKSIVAVDKEDSSRNLYSWSIAKCLIGEIDLNGEQYCASSGRWYCISRDYAGQVNDEYARAVCFNASTFPRCEEEESEGDYNKRLAKSNSDYLLMDAKNISYGYGQSSIELCDILSGYDTFIHVKHYGGSAPLSHLFNQGLNSAELVQNDSAFVDKANKRIHEQQGHNGHDISRGCVKRVVYAIISEKPSDPPRIPFFSRISYNQAARRLQSMGIDCMICAIPKPKKQKHKPAA